MKKSMFVSQLPTKVQSSIKKELLSLGINNEDLNNALDSRLSDLSDTININKYLKEVK